MEKRIKLFGNVGFFDYKEPFTVVDNDKLKLKLSRNYIKSTPFLIGEINDCKFVLEMKNNEVEIDNNLLSNGYLHSMIEIRENGMCTKKFTIEPLLINKLENSLQIIPEMVKLREDLTALSNDIKKETEDQKNEIADLKQAVKTLAKAVMKIIKVGGEE